MDDFVPDSFENEIETTTSIEPPSHETGEKETIAVPFTITTQDGATYLLHTMVEVVREKEVDNAETANIESRTQEGFDEMSGVESEIKTEEQEFFYDLEGSTIEIESEPAEPSTSTSSHDNVNSGNNAGLLRISQEPSQFRTSSLENDRLWPANKTKALITTIKAHQAQFTKAPKYRKSIWTGISKDLQLRGFTKCDRDECSKKWNNLFRTYKTIKMRGGNGGTWEMFDLVNDVVKCLGWLNPVRVARKSDKTDSELLDESNMEELNRLLKEYRTNREASKSEFMINALMLEDEKTRLLERLENLWS